MNRASARCAALCLAICLSIVSVSCLERQTLSAKDRIVYPLVDKGDAYQAEGVLHKAYACYQEAWRSNNYLFNLYCRLGETARDLGELYKAVYYLKYAVKFYPADPRAYLLLGQLIHKNDPHRAKLYFDKCRELTPAMEQFNLEREILLATQGNPEELQGRDLRKDAQALTGMIRSGKADKALAKALAMDRAYTLQLLKETARLCLIEKMDQPAIRLYNAALAFDGSEALLISIGNIHYRAERYADASGAYLKYADRNPDSGVGYFNQAIIYLNHGLQKRAEAMFALAGEEEYRQERQAALALYKVGKEFPPLEVRGTTRRTEKEKEQDTSRPD